MSEWKPKVRSGLKWESLTLSAEEGFLLSRLDGSTPVESLTHLTGMSPGQIDSALQKLSNSGAIDPPPAPARRAPAPVPIPSAPPRGRVPLMSADASAEAADDDDAAAAIRAALDEASTDALHLPQLAALDGDDTDEGAAVTDPAPREVDAAVDDDGSVDGSNSDDDDDLFAEAEAQAEADNETARAARDDDGAPSPEEPEAERGEDAKGEDAKGEDGKDEEGKDEEGEAKETEEEKETAAVAEANYRKLFETQLHDLPLEEREKLARTESGPVLLALCFDPVPGVIHGIFENPQVGFPHARLVARHHRTPQGIEAVFTRAELARDAQVQRWLMANPMLQDAHFKKLLGPKRIAVIYKWALSRDLPEKNRSKVRNTLRAKWGTAEGDERANLIFTTEGRVLQMLIGLPLDSMTVQQLCARTIHSVMLVQNLARFASTPPALLTHLLRQATVKRQVHLRTMIFQHPNCPSTEKRKTH